MLRSLLVVALLGILSASAWILRPRPPPPPRPPVTAAAPAPSPTPTPEGSEDAPHRKALVDLQEAVEDDPAIAAALGMELDIPPGKAVATWHAARARYREMVLGADLGFPVWRLSRRAPDPELLSRTSRLLLIGRLLASAHARSVPPLFAREEDPGLERLLRAGVAVRFEPLFERAPGEELEVHRERVRTALTASGRAWTTLRDLESLRIPTGPAAGVNSRFRLQNWFGTPFVDPALSVPGVIDVGVYQDRDRIRTAQAPSVLEVDLPAIVGDLVLELNLWRLFHVNHARLELIGAEGTTLVSFSRQDAEAFGTGPSHSASFGYTVRVRADSLPRGLRRMRLTLVGLQPIGTPEPNANLLEILVQTAGPVPPSLAEHRWDAPLPGEAELDRLEEERLSDKLAILEGQIRAAPGDWKPYLAIGLLAREHGRLDDARRSAHAALERSPENPAVHDLVGEVALASGDREAAVRHWWISLDLDPAGRARELLQEHTPEELVGLHWIETVAEFRTVARRVAERRRRARRGEAPAPTAGSELPALAAPKGYRAAPRLVWSAIEAGGADELETGLPLLPPGGLLAHPPILAAALARTRDPGILGPVLDRLLRARSPELRPAFLALVPVLRGMATGVPGKAGWQARALLESLGVHDLPPLPPARLDELLEAVDHGLVPREAARSALFALGREPARRYLSNALGSSRLGVVAIAAEAFPAFAAGPADAARLEAARAGPHGEILQVVLARSYLRLTGKEMTAPPPK